MNTRPDMSPTRLELAGAGLICLAGLMEAFLDRPSLEPAARPPGRPPNGSVPNVALTTHTGAVVRFYDDLVRDKVVVINMMYAGCNNTCPPMMHNLVRVQRMLGERVGKDIFMYSITLRPEQDSALDLAHYAKLHQVQPGWLFLTGTPRDIEQLRYALGFYDPDPAIDRQEARHVGMVRVGNDPFKRWGMVPALADPMQIVSHILHMDRKPPVRAA